MAYNTMPGAWPEQPRSFGAPHPPQKPAFVMKDKHWSEFSSRYAAKLNRNKNGFDVKLFDPNDQTAHKLGPPSQVPDYPHIIEKYGIQVLDAAGFLNHKAAITSGDITGRLAFADWRNPSRDADQWIHPVFRRETWVGITDRQYSLLKPVLLLASAVLDDPVTLNYFHALSMPAASMDIVSHVSAGLTADCKIMDIPDTLSPDQQRAVFQKLCAMRPFTYWVFEDYDEPAMAFTRPMTNQAGECVVATKPQTTQSSIQLRMEFLQVLESHAASVDPDDESYSRILEDTYMMAGIHPSRRAPINHISAIYRTGYFLASILLHEFTHAFSMAYFEVDRTQAKPYEPWVRGNRANEQGWAFENYIFGGVVNPNVIEIPPMHPRFAMYLQCIAAPFGFFTQQEWDVWCMNNGYAHVMDSDRQVGQALPPNRVFPVPQAWVHWLFSDDLWKNQVHRFGLSAVKVPKLQEWGVTFRWEGAIGNYRTGEDRWNTGKVRNCKPNWD